jgi:hypothetical protein
MSNIQRFEPWPQEWPMEDNNGDLVMYDDHMKVVRGLEAKLAKAMETLQDMVVVAEQDEWHKAITGRQMILKAAQITLVELKV